MRIDVIRSGSDANGYVLQNNEEALVIEAGVPISSALKTLGYNTKKVSGVIVTHEHGDHCKHYKDYIKYGMKIYCSKGTASKLGDYPYNIVKLEPLKQISIGNYTITPFPTQHDSEEPFGYIIDHEEFGRLVFATDTYYLKYKIDGMNAIMIECNYSLPILNKNVDDGVIPLFLKNRTMRSHMSLDNCIRTLRANDLSNVETIVLIHLSSRNSDEGLFSSEVERKIGKPVYIAKKGLSIQLNQWK